MNMRLKLLCLLCTCGYLQSHGKDNAIYLGLTMHVAAKYELFSSRGSAYGLWGKAGAGFSLLIEGQDENSLSVMQQVEFLKGDTQYRLGHSNSFGIERYIVASNSEILFPTRLRRLKITAGFALEWTLYGGLYVRSTGSYSGYGNNDLDAADKVIAHVERKIIPLITAGCQYAIRNNLMCQLFLKQAMLNAYPGDPEVYLGASSSGTALHHQPLYMGLGCCFYFNKKS